MHKVLFARKLEAQGLIFMQYFILVKKYFILKSLHWTFFFFFLLFVYAVNWR